MSYPTPHNEGSIKDFAKTVLMPGDPLRARFVAETYLENARLVNNIRGIQGWTGLYKGSPVSVMGSGMGMPSIGIYSYELFNFYEVDNIIRIGSAGGLRERVKLREMVLGMGACTDSNFAAQYKLPGLYAPTASWELLSPPSKPPMKQALNIMWAISYPPTIFIMTSPARHSNGAKWESSPSKWKAQLSI
jgi:purine-nucleoside phosphorylase